VKAGRLREVEAGALRVAFLDSGPEEGWPAVLLHGFPYDVHAYAEVTPHLLARGARVIVPYLRGYGPTRFLQDATPRSGEQAALAADLLALLDALGIERAVLGGYDWGGRAACIAAALWPARVRGLVTVNGYNIQDIARSGLPASPEQEFRHWYQYYFHGERGRLGLAQNRRELIRLLWRLWSPCWDFDDATFARSAPSFDNPDFVDVVIHSYRHRFALVEGDPAVAAIEAALAAQPRIGVPTIHLDGAEDGVSTPGGTAHHRPRFTGRYGYRLVPKAGHNLPQEAPEAFAQAMIDVAST
jgi:pimeloyl-ACP methyl ester carboxylesterase